MKPTSKFFNPVYKKRNLLSRWQVLAESDNSWIIGVCLGWMPEPEYTGNTHGEESLCSFAWLPCSISSKLKQCWVENEQIQGKIGATITTWEIRWQGQQAWRTSGGGVFLTLA